MGSTIAGSGRLFDFLRFGVAATAMLTILLIVVTSAITLRHFMVRRVTFAAHINSHSGLSTSHYVRLMLMAIILMFWNVVITSYGLWFTSLSIPIRPWTTWEDVHYNFSRVDQFPEALIPKSLYRAFYIYWWSVPLSTFMFVGFFAFGKEATGHYKKLLGWIINKVLPRSDLSTLKSPQFIPSFVKYVFFPASE